MPRRLLLVILLAVSTWTACGDAASPARRTVLLVSIDTLRPERLGVYGNAPDVSPRIDALARDAVVFDQALANSPYTLPSHMSMLTGLDPVAHGVQREGSTLSPRVTTLAESLRDAGFRCAAFTDGGFVSGRYGFSHGFETYDDVRDTRPEGAINGFRRFLPSALGWLDAHVDDDVFLFIHTFDVHAPYQEGDPDVLAEFRQRPVQDGPQDAVLYRMKFLYQQEHMRITEYDRMAVLLNDYDAGVHEADAGVGALLDKLREQGRLDDALVIVVSDHGESFVDHGLHVGHGLGLTDDEIHIPLIVKLPGAQARDRRFDAPVDLTDIAPTVLDVFGLRPAPEVYGESLVGLVQGKPRRHETIFGVSPSTESCYVVHDGWKLITHPGIPPLDVIKRHLQPESPPEGGLTEVKGEEYRLSPGPDAVTRRYDRIGDPLALRDALPTGALLFDRSADPHERSNLVTVDENRRLQLNELLVRIYDAAEQTCQELAEVSEPLEGEGAPDPTLTQLGYIGTQSEPEAREQLARLTVEQREALTQPWLPPDMADVIEVDRVMQLVRMAVREGRPVNDDLRDAVPGLGDSLVDWAIENPKFTGRVGWRLHELIELARASGASVDPDHWLDRWRVGGETGAEGSSLMPNPQPPRKH